MNIIPKFSGAVPTDDRSILDALRGSDLIRKATAERDTHVVAFRKTVAAKIAKMEAEADGKYPKQQAELQLLIKESREAEIAYRRKADQAYEFQSKMSAGWSVHGNELARLEAQLAETASSEIVPFISEMLSMADDCFRQREVHQAVTVVNILGEKSSAERSNSSSVLARRAAIREAIEAAEKMRLEPDQSSVPERLQQLRQSLPAIKGA